MARKRVDPQSVAEEVAALGGLTVDALRERWKQLFGSPAPRSLRREFLVKACAYQIQVTAFGGLSAATRRRLKAIANTARTGVAIPTSSSPKIKPGTRLVRAWGGEVHTVTAVADGFEYGGERYRSLSAIARAITGTNWNGPVFFGLRQGRAATAAPDPTEVTVMPGNDGGRASAGNRVGRKPAPVASRDAPPSST